MKELMSTISYVLFPLSMAAALTVVFVAALKTLMRSFHRATAIVLALGVTILAVVGTAELILVRSQPGEFATTPMPTGSALLVLPFVTLAITSLLAQVLAAISGTPLAGKREQTAGVTESCEPEAPAEAQPPANAATEAKPRGRPRKQPPEPSLLDHIDAGKKTSPPKQQQVTNAGIAGKQNTPDEE